MFKFFGETKKITEKLYEQNLELAVKNKTLSLLENLYQTSVLTLMPEDMARKIADIIRKDLNLEFAGVFALEKDGDALLPLAFSVSERLQRVLGDFGISLKNTKITGVSRNDFLKRIIYGKLESSTNDFKDIWEVLLDEKRLAEIKKESHVKTMLMYPLVRGQEADGVLMLGINRDYANLNAFEKASIKSCINAIALLLDKAYLYKDLQASYEVEKRAHEVEKKANEELANLDKVKDQFLTITQHNLRTPLTSIMGYSDLILNGTYGKQNKKTVEVIKKFQILGKGMIRMVNDFLDASAFQLGKDVVQLQLGVALKPLLDEVVGELKFKAEEKGISLTLKQPEQPFIIKADPQKLKAAIFNVIDNSIKYTAKGGVEVKFANHDSVKIIVSDTGIGIAPDHLANLFTKMFERGANAKNISGSGVGLYLSYQIIKSHHGKIWAESEGEGKGSTFYIELPLG
ncbi:MAG: hypothetical protein A3C50_02195 [Candidatus Staskawiczbacteria bacterium RIFCSPHIGHO2_02_FULL_43_16]|uniref:histidine kinase n=1 Tax=Candidatus Staskawiczbacteria bacterium RIFCSPHIGHO2_01_FULL_41_41 TaxID=1802203 RepID=A0A1G2HW32_9BACT|nr:MAG: hypothetical protein A2822_00565 [Candidatus Staskawiczbacteria bacterium RIFCSPHIGHO2_01_FULL_41_41]OGZ68488.1 MAG: hypothetical protein A3C50_02195 [Candidatus Staskawiczbacteria bacterium RIFCSPHIGHO2_02_FULL_43_16]OGZ74292.1 MAG: hypothetical protein A3A12_02630 [Candidatus Staskawiczbacteria bacterium RIFCSPLOWO2_01_FULL_43_17b]